MCRLQNIAMCNYQESVTYIWRQDTVSYKKQEGFPQIKNSVVGIPAI